MKGQSGMTALLAAKARQAPSYLHEMVFAGHKIMEHEVRTFPFYRMIRIAVSIE